MTFSLRPSSVSALPLTAASVSTRVVSWKEAAEMKERVCSEALVMPSSTGCAGGRLARPGQPPCCLVEIDPVHLLALEEVGVARIVDLDLLQHLPDDHLDVLVVDGHALQSVDFLDLVDEIVGELLDALDGQDVVRRRVAVDQYSPFSMRSPSCTRECLPFGIRYSTGSPPSSFGAIVMRRLFL